MPGHPDDLFRILTGNSAQDFIVPANEDEEIDRLNTGIAIVTPIQEVLNIINGDEVMNYRKKAEREFVRRHQPSYDPIVPPRRKKQTRKKRLKNSRANRVILLRLQGLRRI
jgi:hypothetical protein